MKFAITCKMIQFLNLKGVSLRAATNDANMHLASFSGIFTLYTIPVGGFGIFEIMIVLFLLTG